MSSPLSAASSLAGGCHCGSVRLVYTSAPVPADTHPRACDCSFCRMHGAAYVSDPAGALRIAVADAQALLSYRQGSEAALFRLCGRCGVLVAVTYEQDGRMYAAVNAGCLDERDAFAPAVGASPQLLSREQKIGRWTRLWVPEVEWA
ncbi:GFA family protein [Lysobacter sp. Root604]|uniref:GFA family protein n=1 Tax=Lysobacter sp. Root604 TaxID=1736568 RepID=UPI000700FCA9|nr:GFA family protein [Lysobacter sp. Root604]KRA21296.1 aldehyde-activating protein [Lysobacter sp. Root604]